MRGIQKMTSIKESLKNFVEGTQVQEEKEVSTNVTNQSSHKHHEKSFTERVTSMIEKGESKGARTAYTVIAVIMALIIIGCLIELCLTIVELCQRNCTIKLTLITNIDIPRRLIVKFVVNVIVFLFHFNIYTTDW
jgi:hypothetical protein